MNIINRMRIRKWVRNGATIGEGFKLERGARIDSSFPYLISIGNNVTLAPGALILSHDGSTKKIVGGTKICKTSIGNNVFVGAAVVVLPGVMVGSDVIIGAGSIVTKDVPDGVVVAGNPAKIIGTVESIKNKYQDIRVFDYSFNSSQKPSLDKRDLIREEISKKGFAFIE